jgi:hypothetical protein
MGSCVVGSRGRGVVDRDSADALRAIGRFVRLARGMARLDCMTVMAVELVVRRARRVSRRTMRTVRLSVSLAARMAFGAVGLVVCRAWVMSRMTFRAVGLVMRRTRELVVDRMMALGAVWFAMGRA